MKKILFLLIVLSFCMCTRQSATLTILHTNDTHSQVLPKDNGQGGYARRLGFIMQERSKDPNLLLLDAGDFSQGTTFFNFFHGRIEVDALNKMGYDVVCLGNHELDYGVDTLAAMLKNAKFEVVCANYDVQGSALEGIVNPYTIIHRNGLKIGVFGIGCNPNGLIAPNRFEPLIYLPPYETAQRMADLLKKRKHCDVVICLSHQGTEAPSPGDCSDVDLVATTRNIDLVIGGHTHKIYENFYVANLDGIQIPLVQAGKSGIKIGKVILKTATL